MEINCYYGDGFKDSIFISIWPKLILLCIISTQKYKSRDAKVLIKIQRIYSASVIFYGFYSSAKK